MTETQLMEKLNDVEKEIGERCEFVYISKGEFYADGVEEWTFGFVDMGDDDWKGIENERNEFASRLFDLSLSSTIVKADAFGAGVKSFAILRIQVEESGDTNISADVIEKLLSMVAAEEE